MTPDSTISMNARKTDSYLLHGIGRLGFAIAWNAIVGVVAFFVFTGKHPMFFKIVVGLFVLIGPLVLFGGIRALIGGMRYRTSVVTLDREPVRTGERLTGHLSWPKLPPGEVRISLECVRREAKNREVLWSEERAVPALSLQRGELETSLPFAFELPPELPASGRVGDSIEHLWLLTTKIGKPGLTEFMSEFPIAVEKHA